ncbi:MAG: hypothetical protein MRY79_05675 [Alphaproteobacteria bacterium]|nr:hypothetical protein [Alphaproteobacteria bacterium]
MSQNDAKIIQDYNAKSTLSRVLLSPSWGAGWIAGYTAALFNKASGAQKEKETNLLVNDSYYLVYGSAAVAKWAGVAAVKTATDVLAPIALGVIVADAWGLGTGKPFGAMHAGYLEGKIGFVPRDPNNGSSSKRKNTKAPTVT